GAGAGADVDRGRRREDRGSDLPVPGAQPVMYFVVLRRCGPDWDPSLPLDEQRGWDEHASFMNGLVRDGFVVLGGPLEDELRVVLAVSARSEEDVRATLSRDPWSGSLLE